MLLGLLSVSSYVQGSGFPIPDQPLAHALSHLWAFVQQNLGLPFRLQYKCLFFPFTVPNYHLAPGESIHLCMHASTYPVHPSSVHVSICVSICASVCPSVHPYIYPPIIPSIRHPSSNLPPFHTPTDPTTIYPSSCPLTRACMHQSDHLTGVHTECVL